MDSQTKKLANLFQFPKAGNYNAIPAFTTKCVCNIKKNRQENDQISGTGNYDKKLVWV